jgi:hypothetical protein
MAGLIKDQMAQGPAQAEQPMPGQAMGMQGAEEGPDPQQDPGFQQAAQFAMEALYKNKAAKQIAQALRTAPNVVDALANTAYDIVSMTDEKTNGAVPNEMLVAFAIFVLGEVTEIAEAAGVKLQPSDAAMAVKQMILRFLGEQGVDTTQLQQAMDQVDPEEFNRAAEESEPEEVPA